MSGDGWTVAKSLPPRGRGPVRRTVGDAGASEGIGEGRVLITGGAGFIGTNLAHRLASEGRSVLIYDNLSRPGVERNLAWLRRVHGDLVRAEIGDLRDFDALKRAVRGAVQVFHFAAQVAVTTSLRDPREDFAVNAGGTLNLLEAIRGSAKQPPLIFTSTNKVYGGLGDLQTVALPTRYAVPPGSRDASGIDEHRPLDFHSPYGCSKGAADQYVLDYADSFGLKTLVFRMSCIYGPHQCGTEDQGWVAHFLLCALAGKPITLYGDGKQVRDILYVDDLIDAMLEAERHIDRLAGHAFNIGGGASNAVSLAELLDLIGVLGSSRPQVEFGAWRAGDQRFYVSDHGAFTRATGWRPRVAARAGVERLYRWLREHRVAAEHPPMPPTPILAAVPRLGMAVENSDRT
ncbi:MAG: NAD-dependent epimerase/dehydratase family protein [Alphaproteobacteria bacterium]|nr:NAD-dependent epimerase/dehydratase family protein [Alphaproteobacteria bacterium]